MRRFYLDRREDETGISGTGRVAEGIQFSDGTCVLCWMSGVSSTSVYRSISDVVTVHGHEGKTVVVWLDTRKDA